MKRIAHAVDGAALGFEVGADLQRDALTSVAVQALVGVAAEHDARVRGGRVPGEHTVVNRQGEAERSGPVRSEADRDQSMRVRGEHLATDADAVLLVGDRDEARVQVQSPLVVPGPSPVGEVQLYLGQGQVGPERPWSARQMLGGEPLCLGVVSCEEELADARNLLPSGRTQVRCRRTARPRGRLGELDPLPVSAAVDHASQAAVADGQRFEPTS